MQQPFELQFPRLPSLPAFPSLPPLMLNKYFNTRIKLLVDENVNRFIKVSFAT